MIEIRDLTKHYDAFPAVRSLDLQVAPGEIFGFIGPNGAGKTTTIKMIVGILKPSAGQVVVCGYNMTDAPQEAKRRIGFIPDRPFVYEKLTGTEFLHFCGQMRMIPDVRKRAAYWLERFSLTDWGEELVESYSHGMKQRLVIAAALLHDPPVIVVDEPMVGLDPAGIRLVKELLREKSRAGGAVFMSTHSLEIAEGLCDRIGVINQGEIIALGSADELRKQARLREGHLEEIFLRLTGQAAP